MAVFAALFSILFPINEYILMYTNLTGAIFVGGAGACIIGGFYWSRGGTAGAWAGMIVGSTLAVGGVLCNNVLWPRVLPWLKGQYPGVGWLNALPETFWFNGVQLTFGTALLRRPRLRRRLAARASVGRSTSTGSCTAASTPSRTIVPRRSDDMRWYHRMGYTDKFTRGDKAIYVAHLIYSLGFLGAFFGLIALYLLAPVLGYARMGERDWAGWWLFNTVVAFVVGGITVVWYGTGGVQDLRRMFRMLGALKRDAADDGSVARQEAHGTDRADHRPEPGRGIGARKPEPAALGAGRPAVAEPRERGSNGTAR